LFFSEPETAYHSESKAKDNKGDELLKIIEETVQSSLYENSEEPVLSEPIVILEGEGLTSNPESIQGEGVNVDLTPVQVQGESSKSSETLT
jgi:hypothetical protein